MRETFWLSDNGEGGNGVAEQPVQPAEPVQATQPAQTVQPDDSQWSSFRDEFKRYGVDLSGFANDEAALVHMASVIRQAQQVIPQFQQVQPHLADFYRWRDEQTKQTPKQEKWAWKAPNYDPSWQYQITRNPVTGQLEPAAGAPHDIVQRYQNGQREFTDTLYSLLKDPLGAIAPGIEEMVKPLVERMVAERISTAQAETSANNFLQQHAGWLFNVDQNKQPVLDPLTRKPTLSQFGQKFYHHLQRAAGLGISDPNRQQEYAFDMMRLEIQPANGDAKQNFLQQQAARTAPSAPAGAAPQLPVGSLKNRLAQALQAEGLGASDVLD